MATSKTSVTSKVVLSRNNLSGEDTANTIPFTCGVSAVGMGPQETSKKSDPAGELVSRD